MSTLKTLFFIALTLFLPSGLVHALGFTDSSVTFYGEVRQVGGAQTSLLQSGTLEVTFVNQANPLNRVVLETSLRPTGAGEAKPFSYVLQVPLAYLPEAPRLGEFLAIGAQETSFQIEDVTIDGTPATLLDGSTEFYGLSFASRAAQYRLDLQVVGDSTDSDGDGMPDWWEELHGLDSQLADSGTDFDDDGWSNLHEFRLGSDPTVSNRDPQLATAEVFVSESGEAGVFLHILDSDTEATDIQVSVSGLQGGGLELLVDGVALLAGAEETVTLSELHAGCLTVRHRDRAVSAFVLPMSWNDGGEVVTGAVTVRVVAPSTTDGNDSTLWLDGMDLPADGSPLASWSDRSGNGRNASQPLPAYQPMVIDQAADFSASATSHLFFQDAVLPPGNHTVLAAYRAAASADAPQTLLSTNRGFLKLEPTTQAVSYAGAASYQMDGLAVRGYENTLGETVTSIFRREGQVLQNVFGLSYDGHRIAAETLDPVLPTIGARRSASPSGSDPVDQVFGGQIHELLVFPTALPEQKLRDVHDYLQSKWGGSVIWDHSTDLKALSLSPNGAQAHIIRGGHGDDTLSGGPLDDILSGGPGDDRLGGGAGSDQFVFGAVDSGTDRIVDFEMAADIIDLSAHFWNQTGDARQFISVRLDSNFASEIPTLDSVLVVQHPDGGTQEIVLENAVVGATELMQLIVEGRIRMGGLSIPAGVQVALAPGSPTGPLRESLDDPFMLILTRSGDGVAAELEVPLGFFEDALGGHFVVDEAEVNASSRSVVRFARGETRKTLTVRPVPDLTTSGPTTVAVAVLPHYKYTVGGTSAERTITDEAIVILEVVEANAVSGTAQPAKVRVHRDGDLGEALVVDFELGGTAEEGVHLETVSRSLTIAAGQSFGEVQIAARAAGLLDGPKVILFQLTSREGYQLGNPNEAVLYAAATDAEANGAGFDRWLQASTGGGLTRLGDLAGFPREIVDQYLQAYAFGRDSAMDPSAMPVSFQIVAGRPELLAQGSVPSADLRWGVESSGRLGIWNDVSGTFTGAAQSGGRTFTGEPLAEGPVGSFYRLTMTLEAGQFSAGSITALAGTDQFGISGNGTWQTNLESGELIGTGGLAGESSWITAKVEDGSVLNFEMEVADGGPDDMLIFYLDGVKQAETSGDSVSVQQELEGSSSHLLTWQFQRGTGRAVIRNLGE
ncbi:MAG: hypothetical protein ACJA16_002699 [Akkermansiaceae bacterium]|jgi:hypothetical protein